MLKQQFIAAAILGLGFAATAAPNYFVVTPALSQGSGTGGQGGDTGGTAPQPSPASIALNTATLPEGTRGEPYSFDFKTLTSVTGGTGGITDAAYSIDGGSIPAGLSLSSTGLLTGTPTATTIPAGQSFVVLGSYQGVSDSKTYTVKIKDKGSISCLKLLKDNPGIASGWYELDIDGGGPRPPKQYYCDMTSSGGGWTRIVRQTESEPVTNWNGGVVGNSYALAQEDIPVHTQVGFGKDENATFIDYVNFIYSTGDIPVANVSNPETGKVYQVHRAVNSYYPNHVASGSPTGFPFAAGLHWGNSLVLSQPHRYGWAFSPHVHVVGYRGSRMGLGDILGWDDFAWTIWVR